MKSEWDTLWTEHKFLTAFNKDLYIEDFLTKVKTEGDNIRDTLNLTYKDLEEVMDEKQKLVNHHYQKRVEFQDKFEKIKYLWQMIGLEEGDFVLPDDAAIMRQIDEFFQTTVKSDKLGLKEG